MITKKGFIALASSSLVFMSVFAALLLVNLNPVSAQNVTVAAEVEVELASGQKFYLLPTSDALDEFVVNATGTAFTVTTNLSTGTVKIRSNEGVDMGLTHNSLNLALTSCATSSLLTVQANITAAVAVTITPPTTSGNISCSNSLAAPASSGPGGSPPGASPPPPPPPALPPTPPALPPTTPEDDIIAKYIATAPEWGKPWVTEACKKELLDCTLKPSFFAALTRDLGYGMLADGSHLKSNTAKSPFPDISGKPYEETANTAYTLGWTIGMSGRFAASGNFTRAQISVAMKALLGLKDAPLSVLNAYTDKDSIPDWARPGVAAMVQAKLIGQGGITKMKPNDLITRVEAIIVINAAFNYLSKNEIDVLEVAAKRMGVDSDLVQEALDTGMNIKGGELIEP